MLFFREKFFTAIGMLLWVSAITAQPDYFHNEFRHQKDSLAEVLKKYPNPDTERAKALFNIVGCASFLNEKKEVMPYWQEAIKLSRKLNYKNTEASCLVWMGGYFKSAQKIDSAIIYLDSGIQLANSTGDKRLNHTKGMGFYVKGMIYENRENYYTALQNYFESLKNYDSNAVVSQKNIYTRIASIYQTLNNDEEALVYYKRLLSLLKKEIDRDHNAQGFKLAEACTSIAGIYLKRNDLSNAKYYLDALNSVMPDTVETQLTGSYYQLLGKIAEKEKKIYLSIRYLKEALKFFNYNKFMHANSVSDVLIDIARLKMESGNMTEAKEYAVQALAAAKESGHKETMADALTVMAAYDHKSGDASEAYQALLQAMLLNDTVLAAANIKQANTLSAIYESNRKEKEIVQLQSDKQIQAATVKQKSLLNIIFIIALSALLLAGTLLYRDFRSKYQLNKQQQVIQQQKITQLEKEKYLMAVEAMLKGQEEERARLAKDLHDGLGGMLSGVKISFLNMKENMIMTADNAAVFEKSIAQLDNSIKELRKVAHNLMPEALVKFGLKNAVKDFCQSIQTSVNTEIICEQLGDERELGNTADVNVYRIIQELLANAIKYAGANQILVQLTKTPDKVLITVEDNGKGFDVRELEKSSGIGFANLRYRVNYLNGKMELNSTPSEGTTVNIELMA
jgi:two-component system, NarL family, sensor kinase